MGVVLLVVAIVGGVGLIQAAIWIPLIVRWRKRAAAYSTTLAEQMAASGERAVLGPEKAIYRGRSSGAYSAAKGNGAILLTDQRLLFRKVTSGTVEVPTADIASTRTAASFLSSRVGGRTHLIVITHAGAELGFFVNDLDAWVRALDDLVRTPPG